MKTADAKTRSDPISIRLPDELKASLSDAATSSGRSVNAEIRMRLEWSFEAGGFSAQAPDTMLANEIETLRAEARGGLQSVRDEVEVIKADIDVLMSRLKELGIAI